MNSDLNSCEPWEPCALGTISGMVAGVKTRQRQGRFERSTVVSGTLAMVLLAGGLAAHHFHTRGHEDVPGMTCRQVQQLLPDLVADRLDAALARRVRTHLANCPGCDRRYRQMLQQPRQTARVKSGQPKYVQPVLLGHERPVISSLRRTMGR